MKKQIIIISSFISIIVFFLFFVGIFYSGLTLFSGVYNYDALSSMATLFSAIFGPLVSAIAAVLFYSSLISQRESIQTQKDEFSELIKTNNFNIDNLNYSLLLEEIKDFNIKSSIKTQNHYSTSASTELREIELINELNLHLRNPGIALKQPYGIMGDSRYVEKEIIHIEIGDKVLYKGFCCDAIKRNQDEIVKLENIERRFWILFGTMYSLIAHSTNKEIQKRIFASLLPYEYLEYSLGLFGKRGGYPDSSIISELLDLY